MVSPEAMAAAMARIRPLILGHGGDIAIEEAGGVVSVRLFGACRACPNMAMTYVGPVRSFLMEVPGVIEVKCEQVHAGPRALARLAGMLGARPYDGAVS
jgi:Fe-S cluster biogenesis protein NfuA